MSKREICQEVEAMIPAYALGALDSGERAFVESHLQACPDCRQKVLEYQAISDGLLHLAPTATPPPELRRKVEAAFPAESRQIGHLLTDFWQRPLVARLAVGAAVAGLFLVNILLLGRVDALVQQQQQLQAQVDRNQTAMAVMTYPTTVTVDFQGETTFGTLVYDPGRPIAVLYAWGLEPLPQGQTYQAWLRQPSGQRVSAGTIEVETGGQFTVVLLQAPAPIEQFAGLGVTEEPGGGSPSPTGDQVLTVDF